MDQNQNFNIIVTPNGVQLFRPHKVTTILKRKDGNGYNVIFECKSMPPVPGEPPASSHVHYGDKMVTTIGMTAEGLDALFMAWIALRKDPSEILNQDSNPIQSQIKLSTENANPQ